jgi:methyl-accepting chemotaxis protein
MSIGFDARGTGGSINSIWNGSWNDLATEKTAKDVGIAVEKASQKIIGAVDKDTAATKANAEKICDAIGKIKPTNNTEQPAAPSPTVKVLYQGLRSVSESTSQIAEQVIARPGELKATMESASAIVRQLTDLVTSASKAAEDSEGLREVAIEASQTSRWIGGNTTGGCNQNISIGNGAFPVLWSQYGN